MIMYYYNYNTEYLVPGDVEAGDAKRRVLVVLIAVDDQLPVVNASREADIAKNHSVIKATRRHSAIVVCKQHIASCRRRIKPKPRHYNNNNNNNNRFITMLT